MVTTAQIKKLFPKAKPELVAAIVDHWDEAEAIGITTPLRTAGFFAQIGPETGGLTSVSESLNYSVDALLTMFGRHRISEADARRLGRKKGERSLPIARQKEIANIIYGGEWGRKNLGNTQPGDGWLYRGGGGMQTTGRTNYRALGFEANPDALRDPVTAFRTALREWAKRGCNARADRGDTAGNRKAINGGKNGLEESLSYYARALPIFSAGGKAAPKPRPAPIPAPRPEPEVTQAEVEAAVEIVEAVKTMSKLPNGDKLLAVQQMLDDKGWHEVGTVDGKWGNKTETAAFAFRNEQNPKLIPLEGGIDEAFIAALKVAAPRGISSERVNTTGSDLVKKGDETAITAKDLIVGAGGLGATAGIGGVDQQGTLDKATKALDGFDTAKEIMGRVVGGLQWVLQHWWMPVLLIAAYLGWKAWKVWRLRERAHQTARDLTF